MFDQPFTLTSKSIYKSVLQMLPDPANFGVAVVIPLVSCVQAEVHVVANALAVTGGHQLISCSTGR